MSIKNFLPDVGSAGCAFNKVYYNVATLQLRQREFEYVGIFVTKILDG
ncbi:MAG: hypothetical protein LBT09_02350 [Planctomycetaceae bacterium]|jgi:hypothetical protein|nr:hypothetical protein [Planctomycetaceae bacterium]